MIPYAAVALACIGLAALTAVACLVAWVREDRALTAAAKSEDDANVRIWVRTLHSDTPIHDDLAVEQLLRDLDAWGA